MRICLNTTIESPHQMPLATALAGSLGADNFRYVVKESLDQDRASLGWKIVGEAVWMLADRADEATRRKIEDWMVTSDVLLCGNRDFDCFERRVKTGRTTLYMSERWLKPPLGFLRLLHPRYFRMVLRFFRLLESPVFYYLPMGVHAVSDMQRLERLLAPVLFCMRRRRAAARSINQAMRLWGYFVAPSSREQGAENAHAHASQFKADVRAENESACAPTGTWAPLHVLWAGRMLNCKRVNTLIRAVGCLIEEGRPIHLKLVGQGPERENLVQLADRVNRRSLKNSTRRATANSMSPDGVTALTVTEADKAPVTFLPPVPIACVRELMCQADVYVLPSDGGEGWGAVVNEAMAEGCATLATHECGAAATLIRDGENGLLFHAGYTGKLAQRLRKLQDDPALRMRLARNGAETVGRLWSPEIAARRLLAFCAACLSDQALPCYREGPLAEVTR